MQIESQRTALDGTELGGTPCTNALQAAPRIHPSGSPIRHSRFPRCSRALLIARGETRAPVSPRRNVSRTSSSLDNVSLLLMYTHVQPPARASHSLLVPMTMAIEHGYTPSSSSLSLFLFPSFSLALFLEGAYKRIGDNSLIALSASTALQRWPVPFLLSSGYRSRAACAHYLRSLQMVHRPRDARSRARAN